MEFSYIATPREERFVTPKGPRIPRRVGTCLEQPLAGNVRHRTRKSSFPKGGGKGGGNERIVAQKRVRDRSAGGRVVTPNIVG